jgi:hypothetical protein
MLTLPTNNVFLSEQELPVVLAALNNAIRDNRGLSSDTIDLIIGARNEIQYAYAQMLEVD